jgi:adenine-specific DNA-methyltransferase
VNPAGQNIRDNVPARSHDYFHIYARSLDNAAMQLRELTEAEEKAYKSGSGNVAFIWDNLRRRGGNSRPSDRPGQWYPLYVSIDPPRVELAPFEGATELYPIDQKGEKRIWRNNPAGTAREIAAGNISVVRKASRLEIVKKSFMPEGKKWKTLWTDSRYSATSHGTKLLLDIIPRAAFSYPKSVWLVQDCVSMWCDENGVALDPFAGSGTTGHAVINLNREDGGRRKFILVEMGDYFDTVLLSRIKKVTFTPEWKDGKPKRLATPEEAERSPRIVKVVRLESYEDALNNLDLRRSEAQKKLLLLPDVQGADGLKEQYLLRYMLDVETRGSQSLLNVQAFGDPTAYTLKVKRPGSDESREVNVDLLETFNWLIGLTVKHIAAPQTFSAAFERDSEKRLIIHDRIKLDTNGPYWFRTVTGSTPDGRKTLIIWRKLAGEPEQDNLVLDEWYTKQGYSAKDSEFDLIYVNGGNNLENLKTPDDLWKVRLIEEDFQRLMFEMEGV